MAETRTDRTDYLGLLALMVAAADTQGWAYPYWNMEQLDAALNALANAVRDGTVPLVASAVAPSLTLLESGGYLAGGQTVEVAQTFVDEWGRETAAGLAGSISTGTSIADPLVALAIGTPVPSAVSGFEGGLLEVWYSLYDAANGETIASPVASITLPYLAVGSYSQVPLTLPAAPSVAGAAGANIYIRHRGGNVVLADQIQDPAETEITLDGLIFNCWRSLPLVNSTGSTRAIEITGVAAPAGGVLTRFYVRLAGQEWVNGDRRLKLGGVDEYDPATVTYPLTYTGATGELAPGWPPTTSQVKAIRPIDLETETTGTLDVSQVPDEVTLDTELVRSTGEGVLSGFAVTEQAIPDLTVHVATGEVLLEAGRFAPAADDLTIPVADVTHHRIDLICIADDGVIEGPTENAALKGTAATPPVAPATPAGYIKLAEINVGEGATTIVTADITDFRLLTTTLVAETAARVAHEATTAHLGASVSETNTGTDTTKRLTADGLAGSYAGTKSMSIVAVERATDVETGSGKIEFVIPPALNGMNLIYANAWVTTAGTTATTDVMIYNKTDSAEMLSADISVASGDTEGTPGTIDTALDDVATGDILRIDVTAQCTTPAKGLMVVLEFQLP